MGWSILQMKVVNKEVLMVYMRTLEHVADELYSSSQVWSHTVLRCRLRISRLYFLSFAVIFFWTFMLSLAERATMYDLCC